MEGKKTRTESRICKESFGRETGICTSYVTNGWRRLFHACWCMSFSDLIALHNFVGHAASLLHVVVYITYLHYLFSWRLDVKPSWTILSISSICQSVYALYTPMFFSKHYLFTVAHTLFTLFCEFKRVFLTNICDTLFELSFKNTPLQVSVGNPPKPTVPRNSFAQTILNF